MKKSLYAILVCVLAAIAVFPLAACSDNDATMQTNVKYIAGDDASEDAEKQAYYMFYGDGTGIYKYYYYNEYSHITSDYTVKFTYTYADKDKSAVACLYDSIEYGENHNDTYKIESTWTKLLTVSENVLFGSTGSMYINEIYLKLHPHFGS